MQVPSHVSFDPSPAGRPCPACGDPNPEVFYSVAGIPVHSCVLLDSPDSARAFPTGDLALAHCESCGMLFNAAFEQERLDYGEDYEETQGCSGTFRGWLEEMTRALIARTGLERGCVVEVGCGRGDFLELLCRLSGSCGIGIDPSSTAGRVDHAAGGGLSFRKEHYGARHADLDCDLLACRHTLEHLPEVAAFARQVRANLRSAFVFIEVPDTLRILEEGAFWDVYYEHCSYFTPGSLGRLFKRHGFRLRSLEPVYGDQYVQLLAHTDSGQASVPEDRARIRSAVAAFRETCRASIARWHDFLTQAQGPILLWGSGSKATGFLSTLGAGERVGAVVDINPAKHGRFVAGSGHPIIAPEETVAWKPRHVVIMNPIYREEIGADLERLGVQADLHAL